MSVKDELRIVPTLKVCSLGIWSSCWTEMSDPGTRHLGSGMKHEDITHDDLLCQNDFWSRVHSSSFSVYDVFSSCLSFFPSAAAS